LAAEVSAASFFVSAISILEIELGALQIARRDTAAQGAILRVWIDKQILPRFEGRVLPVDTAVAQRCARLHVPNLRAERDALIAATALVHGLTVVTRNVPDFEPMGVALLNPWIVRRP
jgi:predicted nucleic acid-binding protein